MDVPTDYKNGTQATDKVNKHLVTTNENEINNEPSIQQDHSSDNNNKLHQTDSFETIIDHTNANSSQILSTDDKIVDKCEKISCKETEFNQSDTDINNKNYNDDAHNVHCATNLSLNLSKELIVTNRTSSENDCNTRNANNSNSEINDTAIPLKNVSIKPEIPTAETTATATKVNEKLVEASRTEQKTAAKSPSTDNEINSATKTE